MLIIYFTGGKVNNFITNKQEKDYKLFPHSVFLVFFQCRLSRLATIFGAILLLR